MAGVYIHIPFCKKACHYCNFHFSTSLHRKSDLVKALLHEIEHGISPGENDFSQKIETIYVGGGTPSILESGEIDLLLSAVSGRLKVDEKAEITLESNPDDISPEKLEDWKSLGINRLSIGIQSFRQEELDWMNRAHNAFQAIHCIELAAQKGFTDLNIDLIYGTPTLDNEAWQYNLDLAHKSGVNHLSCYALTVEENTALNHFIRKGKVPPPDEERQALQFEQLTDWAETNGWDHYEISNLCLPGHPSRHNSNYWSGKPYFGFGPSAHSFDGKKTRWNGIANNVRYIDAWLHKNYEPYEIDLLTPKQLLNEKIMTGLRTNDGIAMDAEGGLIEGFTVDEKAFIKWNQSVAKIQEKGLGFLFNGRFKLTKKGRLYADHVATELFF